MQDPFLDPELPDLVSRALELRDRGVELVLEEVCEGRPELIEAVSQSIATSERLPRLQAASAMLDAYRGRVLSGRYRLVERLGAGAMGVVYRADDLELNRPVALKILRATLMNDEEADSRFQREAEMLAVLHHSAVVTVHDRGRTDEEDPYLVMELLEGVSLAQMLDLGRSAGITPQIRDTTWIAQGLEIDGVEEHSYLRAVVSWVAELASGLEAAHRKGILHRDVKPSNVFLRRDGRPVLIDFGIAFSAGEATLTQEGSSIGTPAYMAPEALEGPGTPPNAALDVYGLGATLYHLLTFRPPYEGAPTRILAQLATKEPRPAVQLRTDLPRDLQAILDRSMARRPAQRYPSAAEFEEDLRAFLDHRQVKARALSPARRLWRRVRRSQGFRAAAVVLVLTSLALGSVQGHAAWRAHRADKLFDEVEHLPPGLNLAPKGVRALTEAAGRAEVAARLDRAAQWCDDPLPTLLIRGAFRLDHGDPVGAAQDLSQVAESVGSPYAVALASRYQDLPADAVGHDALDLAELPDPVEAMDLYLAAYHRLRSRDFQGTREALADTRLDGFGPALELRTFLSRSGVPMYENAVALERVLGGRTATSAHLMSAALVVMQRYEDALEVVEEGLALSPKSTAMNINAGYSAWQEGQIERALGHYREAIESKPTSLKAHAGLVRVLLSQGEFDEAQRELDAVPPSDDPEFLREVAILRGDVEADRGLQLDADPSRREEARAVATAASEHYARAEAYGDPVDTARCRIARAILEGETDPVFVSLLELLEDEPLHPLRIELLIRWWPAALTPEQVTGLHKFHAALAKAEYARQHVRSYR